MNTCYTHENILIFEVRLETHGFMWLQVVKMTPNSSLVLIFGDPVIYFCNKKQSHT